MQSICQASPYWKPSYHPQFQGDFTHTAHLIAVHISHSWITYVFASIVRSTPRSQAHLCITSLPRYPDVSWAHWAINSSVFLSQTRSNWAIPILAALSINSLFWCSSVAQLLGTWVSTWHSFRVMFSTYVEISCHNAAAPMGLPLHHQLVFFQCCSYPQRSLPTIQESVKR